MRFASALSSANCPLSLRPDVIELCQRMVLSCRRALTSPNLFFSALTPHLFSVTNAFFKLLYRCARLSLFFTCNDRVSDPPSLLAPSTPGCRQQLERHPSACQSLGVSPVYIYIDHRPPTHPTFSNSSSSRFVTVSTRFSRKPSWRSGNRQASCHSRALR
jgi:hypothetical protein